MPVPAEVVQIVGRSGAKGVSRVRCKAIDEEHKNKVLIRNVTGPVKIGDILMIAEAEMEYAGAIE